MSQNRIFFGFGWLVATPTASQQHKKIFFLATSSLLEVPVPVLKIQVPVLCMQVQVPVHKYNLSISTSTKYNKNESFTLLS